jgi:spore germination protein YaaH
MTKKVNKPEAVIDQLAKNTRELTSKYWSEIENLGKDGDELKISLVHLVGYDDQGDLSAKSTISFGKRIKDSVEYVVESDQIELPLDGENARQ